MLWKLIIKEKKIVVYGGNINEPYWDPCYKPIHTLQSLTTVSGLDQIHCAFSWERPGVGTRTVLCTPFPLRLTWVIHEIACQRFSFVWPVYPSLCSIELYTQFFRLESGYSVYICYIVRAVTLLSLFCFLVPDIPREYHRWRCKRPLLQTHVSFLRLCYSCGFSTPYFLALKMSLGTSHSAGRSRVT
jgi:hypothetical protein